MTMQIYESAEDYLETILMLQKENGVVHSVDIAHRMNFSKPSVSVAMKKLRENGYISMDKDGTIRLLEKGEAIAIATLEKHRLLTAILVRLGVDEEVAAADACKIEHDLSPQTFEKIKEHLQKYAE